MNEADEIKKRYEKRKMLPANKYSILQPYIYKGEQEKERVFIKWIKSCNLEPLENKSLLEIGAGYGSNIMQLMRLGFLPNMITANELLPERVHELKKRLPASIQIMEGNALELDVKENFFDIVFQSMVFSSILDENFQNKLAEKMWNITKKGGGILWYDFTFDNPWNKDVSGVTYNRVKELFPYGQIKKWRITLAPPLSRLVTKVHPVFYDLFNLFPFLRTHILCWIKKT
jgi:ubiquinone/menaquinone biosynthesis C-methylase UbiE